MRATPKVMPPIFLYWPMTPGVDVGDMAVKAESPCQYSVVYCCRETDDSRKAVRQNGIWCGSVYETKIHDQIPPCRKYCIHWHSSILVKCLWRPKSPSEHSEAIDGAFQQFWQHQWVASTSTDTSTWVHHAGSYSSHVKMHNWWWHLCWKSSVL